jgi:transposase InsO family protein
VRREEANHTVVRLCGAVEVSRSGYYAWRRSLESERTRANRTLLEEIREIHDGSRGVYGAPRVHDELRVRGRRCGRHRVARLMRRAGLRARAKRRFRVTTHSAHRHPTAPNLLAQRFRAERANRTWVADITYIPTRESWLYLAVVIDLFSRRVVGWATSGTMTRALVVDALQVALGRRRVSAGLLHHSDRGSQYASNEYQLLLAREGFVCSMSGRGNCYDNAVAESFFHTLKTELVHHHRYETRAQAHASLFEYIEGFYNRKRKHSSLGYKSPSEYEEGAELRT